MKILNFGSLNIDKVYEVTHFVRPGETIESKSYCCFPGGKGLNQSIAMARAGAEVYHAGTIGNDGGFLKELLKKDNVDVKYIKEDGTVTGNALIQVTEDGENSIILFKGSNYENTKEHMDMVFSNFDSNDILVLQNEVNDLDYLLTCAQKRKMRVLLNPSPINQQLKALDLSDVKWLILNETEGAALTGQTNPEIIIDKLNEKYPNMQVILTMGRRGSLFFDGREKIWQECYPAVTLDSTAAGDTFTGYYIAAVTDGRTPKEALALASCAASITVERKGAALSIPYMKEVVRKFEKYKMR